MLKSAYWLTALMAMITISSVITPARAEDGEEGSGHEGWVLSFEKAKELAGEGEKDILMKFTGSDWCPPCIALEKNVMSKDAFKEQIPEDFVMLYLDSPRQKEQPPEEKEQYQRLSTEYKVRGVPTVVLADPAGRPYAQFVGYGGEEPAAYIAKLQEAKGKRAKRDELMAQAAQAEGLEKAKLLDQVVETIGEDLAFAMYRDVVNDIIANDPNNEAGLKEKYEAKLRAIELEEKIQDVVMFAQQNRGSPEALARFDALLDEYKPAKEQEQTLRFYKAVVLLNASDFDGAKPLLIEALEVDEDSRIAAQIKSIMNQLYKEKEEGDDAGDDDGDQ